METLFETQHSIRFSGAGDAHQNKQMYPSRNPSGLVTKDGSAQDFLEEQDNDKDLVTPIDNIGNNDVTGGDDID
eukprot:9601400-Ditylum_brightwellii.AAC.1